MNRVILTGRLTRDPEVRYSQGERSMAIARYTLAVDRKYKGKDGEQSADFINCIAFDKRGQFAEMYLHQGMKILVEGHWQTGSYVNRDGQKVYTNECVVDSHEFCESKNEGNLPENPRPTASSPIGDGWVNIPEEVDDSGLPFD